MSDLTFKKLVIFSPIEELAKVVELKPGLNIVTSLRKDGNDLGKSIIAKSFYHCLGADCIFDSKFDVDNKVFVLILSYKGKEYVMYRSNSVFKMFDSDLDLLWSTTHRHELGELLHEQFGYAVWLPSRHTNEIEITPPAYSYVLYFIDQNQYNGSDFKSFSNLGQYKNYKESLIYTFAGAYDEAYFEIKAQKEPLESQQKSARKSAELNVAMANRVSNELQNLGYSRNMETLNKDCSQHERDYKQISQQLNKLRDQLYQLRENYAQVELALEGAEALGKRLDKRINVFSGDKCPICNSDIEDPISVRVNACVTYADALLLGDELKKELGDIERKISRKELQYKSFLEKMERLKEAMDSLRQLDLTAVQIEGLTKLSENLTQERERLEHELDGLSEKLDKITKSLKEYAEAKKAVDERYAEMIKFYVSKLNLQSIDVDKIKSPLDRFVASGSNAPLATVAWYFVLLKLKEEFNSSRPNLPLILDSPMNVEADDDKYELHYGMIFSTFKYQHQMLVTGLGLANAEVVPEDANVIILDNEKYHLLKNKDFEDSKEFMFACMEQH